MVKNFLEGGVPPELRYSCWLNTVVLLPYTSMKVMQHKSSESISPLKHRTARCYSRCNDLRNFNFSNAPLKEVVMLVLKHAFTKKR